MGNILIATQDAMSRATVASGPCAGAAPPSNLLRPEPSDPLVLTDLSAAHVTVDMGSAVPVRLIAPLFVGATASAAWRVLAADTEAGLLSAPAYNSGVLPFGRGEAGLRHRRGRVHDWVWLAEAQARRWWRVDFYDAGNPDARLVVGNLVLAEGFQPARNVSYGWQIGLVDPSRKPRAAGGRRPPLGRRPYLAGQFSLDFSTEAEMWGAAFPIDEACGTTRPALVLRDPDLAGNRQPQAIWGLFSDLAPVTNPHHRLYSKRWQIEELIP